MARQEKYYIIKQSFRSGEMQSDKASAFSSAELRDDAFEKIRQNIAQTYKEEEVDSTPNLIEYGSAFSDWAYSVFKENRWEVVLESESDFAIITDNIIPSDYGNQPKPKRQLERLYKILYMIFNSYVSYGQGGSKHSLCAIDLDKKPKVDDIVLLGITGSGNKWTISTLKQIKQGTGAFGGDEFLLESFEDGELRWWTSVDIHALPEEDFKLL